MGRPELQIFHHTNYVLGQGLKRDALARAGALAGAPKVDADDAITALRELSRQAVHVADGQICRGEQDDRVAVASAEIFDRGIGQLDETSLDRLRLRNQWESRERHSGGG